MRSPRRLAFSLGLLLGSWSASLDAFAANPPEALLVIGTVSVPNINASDAGVKARLEAMGFKVTVVVDADSTTDDGTGKALIVTSSTVSSGNVADKFQTVAVPVVNWEQAVQDDYLMTGNEGTDHATLAGQTDVEIVNATHPLAAGLKGIVTLVKSGDTFSWGLPVDTGVKIGQIAGDPTQIPLYAYEAGTPMFNGFKAPARRVMLPFGDATFENLNDDGLKLFDAAVKWAATVTTVAPPKINPLTRQGSDFTISWTGSGKLQQADAVTGPWTEAANQSNPQTTTLSSGAKFYRIRQ